MDGRTARCRTMRLAVLVTVLVLACVQITGADIRLPSIVGDHMVLQRGQQVPLWGWADPGEEVRLRVSWHSMERRTAADEDGKWFFTITSPPAGGPYELTLSGKNTVPIRNVLSGEVWVCSGQSNMEWLS